MDFLGSEGFQTQGHRSPMNFDDFYAERVASFDRERHLFDQYIRLVKPEHNEAHDLEWESRNLQEEARLAKQAVASVEQKLKIIQQEVITTTREMRELEAGQVLRKEQIERLVLLARPVGKDTTYIYRDLFPKNHASDFTGARSPGKGKAATSKSIAEEQQEEANSLFRTIKTGEVVKLEQRIHDETLRCTSYLRDLQMALQQAELERLTTAQQQAILREDDVNTATNCWKEVDRNEFQGFFSVSELLRLRYRILVAQRQEIEELERLQHDKEAFVRKEEDAKTHLLEEMNSLQRATQRELSECHRSFEQQLADLDCRIMHWKDKEQRLLSLKEKTQSRERKLHDKLALAKERYFSLKRRNALEMEGYRNQLQQLRLAVKALEKLLRTKSLEAQHVSPRKLRTVS